MALELNNKNVEYKNNKAIIKSLPQNGENLSVFLRPGDEVIFQLEGINAEKLEYLLIGGDIIVSLPGFGSFTFPSLGLMGFSDNAPKLNFGNGKIASIDDIFSHIQEVNELPMESVNANFKIRVNTLDEEKEMMDKKVDSAPSNPIIIVPQNQLSELNEDKKEIFQNSYEQAAKSDVAQDVVTSTAPKNVLYDKPYSRNAKFNDFDAYKPDVEMIPKPDVEMIPKPDVEMIPKPDYETMPKNDFTDYFPDDGSGNGNVSGAAKPVFYFKGTAHQVVQSESVKDTILGGGGSINGYEFDSITNQFEPETIDMSTRTGNMVIKAENTTYFSDAPASTTETHNLTFKDLAAGQSVTVDGLKLTATGAISAADVAVAFENLLAGATSGNDVTGIGSWSGALSTGWHSGYAATATVTFVSTISNTDVADIIVASAGPGAVAPDNSTVQVTTDVYLSRVLRFEPQMPEGFYVDNFSLSGLPSDVTILDKDGNPIVGSTVTRDQMIFKDALGEVIDYNSTDFLTNFKSAEFVIKYANTITDPFNVSITANYTLDSSYTDTTDIEPEQSYTNDYTFALKDITAASDYTYNSSDFEGGQDEGFILAKETNYNIIKDGSGDDTIYGGIVKDVVYDGKGDDTIYLSSGDDTVYGGSGTNYIYGDTNNDSADATKYAGTDTVSYEQVQSFSTSEINWLIENELISPEENQKLNGTYESGEPNPLNVQMLASQKGVYVDLDGIHVDGLTIDVNGDEEIDADDKINSISKFANRVDKFTYDVDGNVTDTALGKNITFTSTTPNAAVEDIIISSGGLTEVAAPLAISISSTQGDGATTETHALTFQNLIAGQSVTVDGLTLTATGNITATDVAAGFAMLVASASTGQNVINGTWSGNLSTAWASNIASGATVTFTSQTTTTAVTDIVFSSNGRSALSDPEDALILAIQGSDMTTEKHNVVFKDLIAGQSVSVGGLTLTATDSLSATQIAAGFANLNAGAIVGNTVADGTWSGTLSNNWTSGTQEESGLENLQAIGYDIFENIENITGSSYNDELYGNDDKVNVLSGLGGDDIIDGRGGDNKLLGGAGYDILYSGSGNDFIDGGEDTDKANYTNSANGVIVRLDKPNEESENDYAESYSNATLVHNVQSGELSAYTYNQLAYTDTLLNIEDVTGSNHADILFGSGATNYIEGMGGDDKIIGGAGYDFLDGGTGSDWISYYEPDYTHINSIIPNGAANSNFMEKIEGITVTMGTDFVMLKDPVTGRLIDLIKDIEQVSGTKGNDVIIARDNVSYKFWGHEGNDRLEGRNGADFLYGGDDDDYIRPYGGRDISYGGDGTDYLELYNDGLVAGQTLRLHETNGAIQYLTGVTTDGINGNWTDGYNASGGINLAYEFESFSGSDFIDTLYGNSKDNVLNGHNGADTIYGLSGKDTINGGDDNDTIYGGEGNDILSGGNHDDIMNGDAGDDVFYGSIRYTNLISDKDIHNGGTGTDTLDYGKYNHNYTMNVIIYASYDGTASFGGLANDAMYNDSFTSIERFIASQGSDTINASATTSGMFISGLYGNDIITGGSGNDTLYGGTYIDTITGGAGNDYINLDQYSDTDLRIHGVNSETANGGEGDDTIVSQGGRDYLYGDAGNDIFRVHDTPYNLYGGAGADTLTLGDTYLDLRSTDIKELEILNLGSGGRAHFYYDQFFTNNAFATITGDEYSQLWIYGANGIDDNFSFSGIDVSGFAGKLYANGYNGTDTLTLGSNQTVKMDENYFSTIETFNMGSHSSLNIYAENNNADSFNGHNKNFDAVNGEINFIGSNSDDTFYANYTALLAGKLNIDGKAGSDTVEISLKPGETVPTTLTFDTEHTQLSEFETLRISSASIQSADIEISASAIDTWLGNNSTFRLDVLNNTQANKVTITDATITDITNPSSPTSVNELSLNHSYSISYNNIDHNETFMLAVV